LAAPDYRSMLDALPDAVVAADGSHRIVFANAGVTDLLGWSPNELIGRPVTDLMPPRMQSEHREAFKRFFATRQPRVMGKSLRVPALRRDGRELETELRLSYLAGGGDGGEDLVIGTLRDSREQSALERQRDLARCLRATAEAAARLGARNDPAATLDSVAEALATDFGVALARVWLADSASGRLVLQAAAGPAMPPEDTERGRALSLAWSPAKIEELMNRRVPLVQTALGGDPDFDQRWVARERIAALTAFPLIHADEVLGVLACYHRRAPSAEFVAALSAFAAIVAAAVSDLRMFDRLRVAQAEAENQRRRLQTVLDVLPIGVMLAEGPDGRLTLINPAGLQITGPPLPVKNMTDLARLAPLYHLDGRPCDPEDRPLRRTLREGARTNDTLLYRRPDGPVVTLEIATAPFPGPHGGAISVFRDVTEEIRLKNELAERATQMKTLLDHLPVGVVYFDPRGVCRVANGPARRVLGRSRSGIVGANADELFRHVPALNDALAVCLERQAPHVEASSPWPEGMDPDGPRYLDWRLEPLPVTNGRVAGALALVVDVTEKKRANDALRRAAEAAEQASRNKTQFLSAVSHDLRTPVNALSLQAEWLGHLVTRQKEADPELVLISDDIRRASANLIELVNDLLELSLLDSGVLEHHASDFSLDEWLETVLAPLRVTARAKALEFSWRVDHPGRTIHGDRVKLGRVLVNLAGNAVKFTEHGSVEVVAGADPTGRLVLTVTDTGPGIPESQRDRIFDEFAQLRNPERDRTKGTGLGLAICRRLVAASGGTLTVASREGAGTRFTATYPADHLPSIPHAAPEPAEPGPGAPAAATLAQGPILLVEDDPYSRRTLARLLEREGYEVETAETGPDALEAVARRRPALILLDLMLPGLDGGQVLRQLREHSNHDTLPVVILSGDVLTGRTDELEALDVNGMLSKPIELDALRKVLQQWVGVPPARAS
jgi:PAS domain S-box-containing protein